MGHVTFPDQDRTDHLVSEEYSQGRGSVLRSDIMEVVKIRFGKGERADPHRHPQEQVMYVIEGELEITLEGEKYVVKPGEATFNPSNALHEAYALEDTIAVSFKTPLDSTTYEATGELK
jgi:quercetin dioxygenase-like cupin family protein